MRSIIRCGAILAAVVFMSLPVLGGEDPYLWLEEVDSDQAMDWVKAENARSTAELEKVPEFAGIHERTLAILNSKERIPYVAIRGEHLYNLWRDADQPRGIWRRTSLEQYRNAEPEWETVLDIDALGEQEGESWVWKGASCLEPEYRRCMISLSRGGGDSTVVREFDTVDKIFVKDGFSLPDAKSQTSWKDENTLWVGTDFGEGSLTDSGYPRVSKEWRRGTPLEEAPTVFEGLTSDVSAGMYSMFTPEGRYDMGYRTPAFYRGEYFIMLGERLVKLDLPEDVVFQGFFKDQLLIALRSDWQVGGTTYPQDALLAIDFDHFLKGCRKFQMLFEPSEKESFGGLSNTRDRLLITTLDNVRGRLYSLYLVDGEWQRKDLDLPGLGQAGLAATTDRADLFFFFYEDFLTPSSLWLVEGDAAPVQVKSQPAFFDAEGMQVVQHEAVSKDGTRIPYFAVLPKDFEADGSRPTILYGYGGFENSITPFYSGTWGAAWMERGGVAVFANIRGGGEFGPRWHQAALKANRIKAYEDFIAVGKDLIARKITSKKHLGIKGGSNGGLLVGAVMTLEPDLANAVVCQAPLLDMKRYHKLLAGASWMAEYGDPDKPEDWAYIKTWSPYHNVDAEQKYPRILFTTSTRDDRVHPGHARKMAALLLELKQPVLYYENIEGGHSGAADNTQRAYMKSLEMAFMWTMLR